MTDLDAREAFALDVALRAGRLALTMRNDLAPADAKSAIDFCTEADLAVERLIRGEVEERFGDSFIGEEFGGEPGEAVWVVDPIDGTTGYIHGTPRWCVSIGFVLRGVIELGVIYAPATDRLFTARRGRGARLNGRPIEVSGLRHGAVPVVEAGWSERYPLERYFDLVRRLLAARIEFRRIGSGALGLAEVACGLADGYIELHINAWDALAGLLLVTEAGGEVNDFLAGDGLRKGNRLLACTPEMTMPLSAILDAVAKGNGIAA
jgi:myo-inositol-1(or 4)-monophosphatase